MNHAMHEILAPLTDAEKTRIPAVIEKLFHNDDFVLLFRWLNQNCGGIASTSFVQLDPLKAAWMDGHKAPPRDIFRHYLALATPEKEKPQTQETNAA